ncbi:hypothetical protein HDU67_001552, partial [Dinochytrium kinnereticum]
MEAERVVRPVLEPGAITGPALDGNVDLSEMIPEVEMDKSISSISDCWQEYRNGWNGGTALATLNKDFGTKWRRGERIKKAYQRRNAIYRLIEESSQNLRVSELVVVERLE